MSSAARLLVFAARLAVVAAVLSATAFAQSQTDFASEPQGMFSSIHQDLSEAADRSLASVLANQAWMNSSDSSASHNDPSESQETSILKIRAALDRVNQLKPTLEPILRDEGVPVELSAVVLVESGGLTAARSPRGARGVWQFMPDTARRYGLAVDALHDDRLDVTKSTRAAARYLRDLYTRFGDWSLALAAYNAGEVAVSKAMSRIAVQGSGWLADNARLPLETRRYVPAITAALKPLHYESSWLVPERIKNTHIVYASSGSAE